jgi:hypothetical protein
MSSHRSSATAGITLSGSVQTGTALTGAVLAVVALCLTGCSSSPNHATGPATDVSASTSAPSRSATASPVATSSCGGSTGTSVSSASELTRALGVAQPGQTIVLAAGTYDGNFSATRSGTSGAPVTLCGPRSAVLDGGSVQLGYTLHLDHASWWRVEGFTVEGGQKGVMVDHSNYDLLYGLYVHSIGDEGIHLREDSSYDTISHCVVQQTGLLVQFYGEGIYVGSANKNWCRYTGCQPDRSDYNLIEDNSISDTTAENIDIKEGTSGGRIIGNHFNGTGMVASAATAWVNVKGNDWTISGNTGIDSIKDGFQVHQVYPGWGIGNVFTGNTAEVNGPGYGFFVQNHRLETVVSCNNKVIDATRGFSTIACSP